jgi:hypothetical protein
LSVTVTALVPTAGTSLAHCTFTGGLVITGFSVSLTVTVKLQVAVLPEASVAVHVTELAPLANVEPLAGLHAVVTPGQLSVAVGGAQVTLLLEH